MGNQQYYIEAGGFEQFLYSTHSAFESQVVNDISGKVILLATDPKGQHYSLPSYSNNSDMYFKVGKDGEVCQGRLYTDRTSVLDFDWSHEHTNDGTKEKFSKGVVHVQSYSIDSDGKLIRLPDARLMTNDEIEKYGPLIHAFNPNVKFR